MPRIDGNKPKEDNQVINNNNEKKEKIEPKKAVNNVFNKLGGKNLDFLQKLNNQIKGGNLPPGMPRKDGNNPKKNEPVINNNNDMVKLLENQPIKIKKDKKKPIKKAFNVE